MTERQGGGTGRPDRPDRAGCESGRDARATEDWGKSCAAGPRHGSGKLFSPGRLFSHL